jgi:hypothetical protein
VSLDAQAELIFAAEANDTPAAEFEFTLSSADATIAGPRGFSDLVGNYTSVVTPRTANPVFDVQACLITAMANGAPVPGVMCGSQTLGGSPSDILVGRVDLSLTAAHPASADLRVRVEPSGRDFTVVSALGSLVVADNGLVNRCSGPGGPVTVIARTFVEGEVTDASYTGSGFLLRGRMITRQDSVNADCSITTTRTVNESTDLHHVPILGIERDAQDRVLAMTVQGRDRSTARLVPQ